MTRYHAYALPNHDDGTPQEDRIEPYTKAEEAAADLADEEWREEKSKRDILHKIVDIEAEITDRRIREAILGQDKGWLAEQNTQISALRKQIQAQ